MHIIKACTTYLITYISQWKKKPGHDSGVNHLEGKAGINIPNSQIPINFVSTTGVKIIIKGKNVRKASFDFV